MASQTNDPYVEPEEDSQLVPKVINPPTAEARLGNVEDFVKAVLVVVVISVGAMVVAVAAIVLDQLHFNNQFYQQGYNLPPKTRDIKQTEVQPVFLKPSLNPQSLAK